MALKTVQTFSKGRLSAGIKHGYRSGLEEKNAAFYLACNASARFEPIKLPYEVHKTSRYTPDFVQPNGIVIETKGRFMSKDRVKHKLVQAQHPDLDIRFVFSNPKARLNKTSKTTYGMWCDKNGFKFAAKLVPEEWMTEPNNEASRAALVALGYDFGEDE